MKKVNFTGIIKIDLIKNYMKENNLSQKRFAEVCKINVWNLRQVLSDGKDFNIIYLFKIAKAMKIDVCNLFND